MARDVSLSEAAVLLGLSPDTVMRRIRAGALTGHKDAAGRWRVRLPPGAESAELAPQTAAGAESGAATAERAAEPAEVIRLQAELDGVRATLAAVELHRDSLTAELEARRREVAELHVLLQQRQLPAPAPVLHTAAPLPVEEPPARPPRVARGWRERVARWLVQGRK